MRAYRARKAGTRPEPETVTDGLRTASDRIRELEAEVAHLKRLLAERSPIVDHAFGHSRPAPK
jgi:hypothetical protein